MEKGPLDDAWEEYPNGYLWDKVVGTFDIVLVLLGALFLIYLATVVTSASNANFGGRPPVYDPNISAQRSLAGGFAFGLGLGGCCLGLLGLLLGNGVRESRKWAFIVSLVIIVASALLNRGGETRPQESNAVWTLVGGCLSLGRILYYSLRLGTVFGPPLV